MMSCIRVSESLHFVVVFPVTHNCHCLVNPGLESYARLPKLGHAGFYTLGYDISPFQG